MPIFILALTGIGVLASTLQSERIGERFTEFNITAQDQQGQKTTIFSRDVSMLNFSVLNHELEPKSYKLRILGDHFIENIQIGSVDQEGEWNYSINFTSRYRSSDELKFELFVDDSPDPYRELHVWLKNDY